MWYTWCSALSLFIDLFAPSSLPWDTHFAILYFLGPRGFLSTCVVNASQRIAYFLAPLFQIQKSARNEGLKRLRFVYSSSSRCHIDSSILQGNPVIVTALHQKKPWPIFEAISKTVMATWSTSWLVAERSYVQGTDTQAACCTDDRFTSGWSFRTLWARRLTVCTGVTDTERLTLGVELEDSVEESVSYRRHACCSVLVLLRCKRWFFAANVGCFSFD